MVRRPGWCSSAASSSRAKKRLTNVSKRHQHAHLLVLTGDVTLAHKLVSRGRYRTRLTTARFGAEVQTQRDADRARTQVWVTNEIVSGMEWINAPILDNDAGPLGGRKISGVGRQLETEGPKLATHRARDSRPGERARLLVVPVLRRRGRRRRRLTLCQHRCRRCRALVIGGANVNRAVEPCVRPLPRRWPVTLHASSDLPRLGWG